MKSPPDQKKLAVTYEQVTDIAPEELQRRLDCAFGVLFRKMDAIYRISKVKK